MRSAVRIKTAAAALALLIAVPQLVRSQEKYCESCQDHVCHGQQCKPAKRWSRDWYEHEAATPVGARQKYHLGKFWPPYPRPVGKDQEMSHGFHANHYWPYPYVCQDRHYVMSVLDRQVVNGWMCETTLYDYHFEADSHRLTKAGEMHLRWILLQVPQQHRVAYIQSTFSPEVNEQRAGHVRQMAAALVGERQIPEIAMRAATPYGRPAQETQMIRQAELQSQPQPRIAVTGATQSGASTTGN